MTAGAGKPTPRGRPACCWSAQAWSVQRGGLVAETAVAVGGYVRRAGAPAGACPRLDADVEEEARGLGRDQCRSGAGFAYPRLCRAASPPVWASCSGWRRAPRRGWRGSGGLASDRAAVGHTRSGTAAAGRCADAGDRGGRPGAVAAPDSRAVAGAGRGARFLRAHPGPVRIRLRGRFLRRPPPAADHPAPVRRGRAGAVRRPGRRRRRGATDGRPGPGAGARGLRVAFSDVEFADFAIGRPGPPPDEGECGVPGATGRGWAPCVGRPAVAGSARLACAPPSPTPPARRARPPTHTQTGKPDTAGPRSANHPVTAAWSPRGSGRDHQTAAAWSPLTASVPPGPSSPRPRSAPAQVRGRAR
ncbi:hypothetical protein SAMN05216259_1042 [Actinacidiphila guanduensis]|uniref:Uncharacterized protein n=1 Tax=Actinacidiphila guanduensis TaxID=310781 RepID=A0A1H0B1R1_9ACTN|nr:hypothetical protein SAMN05216259_1042 [Actinacidiphila guanduensis]